MAILEQAMPQSARQARQPEPPAYLDMSAATRASQPSARKALVHGKRLYARRIVGALAPPRPELEERIRCDREERCEMSVTVRDASAVAAVLFDELKARRCRKHSRHRCTAHPAALRDRERLRYKRSGNPRCPAHRLPLPAARKPEYRTHRTRLGNAAAAGTARRVSAYDAAYRNCVETQSAARHARCAPCGVYDRVAGTR